MTRHVPSQAGNETSEAFDNALLYGCYPTAVQGIPQSSASETQTKQANRVRARLPDYTPALKAELRKLPDKESETINLPG
jgi:hypothetical protein